MSKRFRGRSGGWTVTQGNPFHVPYSGKRTYNVSSARRRLAMSTGYKILKLKRKAPSSLAVINRRTGGYIDLEKKFADSELTATALETSWKTKENATMDCLSAVAIGDGPENRDGRVYHISSITIQGSVNVAVAEAQSSPAANSRVKIKLVLDKQTNAAKMTGGALMDEGGTVNVDSFRLLENSRRFTVLKNKTVLLRPQIVNDGAIDKFSNPLCEWPFTIYHAFKKPLRVQCVGGQSTAVIAAIADNSLHLVACSTLATSTIQYQVRIRFQG